MKNRQERIEELENELRLWKESYDDHSDGMNITVIRDLGNAVELVKDMQEEIERLRESNKYCHKSIDTLAEENKKLTQWQPISTAPKDGNVSFLVYSGDPGFESNNIEIEWSCNSRWYTMNGFTHWMPLPTKPTEQ